MRPQQPDGVDSSRETWLRTIELRLRDAYGQPRHHNPTEPLDDLIFLVLSRMTQETKYVRTYSSVREEYPTWGHARDVPVHELEYSIGDAGLAPTKARQIQQILREIERREGSLDLSRLRALPDAEVEAYLTSLSGVATKTARCVMLYTLDRSTFPVDTHVWRIARRLGLAPDRPWSDRRGRELQDRIPPELRGSLHVTLISHGRAVCRPRRPRCGSCLLRDLCPAAIAEEHTSSPNQGR